MTILMIKIIDWVCTAYTFMIAVRIIGSWFPAFSQHQIMRFLRFYTDPYLNIFRKLIPPIGGMLDLSPLLAFFGLQIIQQLLLYLVR